MWLKSINHSTVMPLDIFAFTQLSKKFGFDGIEYRIVKLKEILNASNKLEDLNNFLKANHLKVVSLNSIENFSLCSEREFEKIVLEFGKYFEFCKNIECDTIIAVPSFLSKESNINKEHIYEKTKERLIKLEKKASKYDIKIGFEFLGFKNCSINNLEEAWKIIRELNMEDIGLVIDTFHFYISNSKLQTLQNIFHEKIYLVHINDVPNIEKNKLKDEHRLFPGEGVIPLYDFLKILKNINYSGFISIELFNEIYWKRDQKEVLKYSSEVLEKIFEKFK